MKIIEIARLCILLCHSITEFSDMKFYVEIVKEKKCIEISEWSKITLLMGFLFLNIKFSTKLVIFEWSYLRKLFRRFYHGKAFLNTIINIHVGE